MKILFFALVATLMAVFECLAYAGSSYTAVLVPSREDAVKAFKNEDYPMILSLRGDKTSKYMVIEKVEDWPTYSLETACPESLQHFDSCWFVRYEKGWNK